MHFFKSLLASALVATAAAQSTVLSFTSPVSDVATGSTVDLKYTAAELSSAVTILLRKGDPENLDTIQTLTTTATGGSYTWDVASILPEGTDYALQITQGSETNYFGPFSILGGPADYSVTSSSVVSYPGPSSIAPYPTPSSVVPYPSPSKTSWAGYGSYNGTSGHAAPTGKPSPYYPTGTGAPYQRNSTFVSATLSTKSGFEISTVFLTATGTPIVPPSPTGTGLATPTNAASLLDSQNALVFGVFALVAILN